MSCFNAQTIILLFALSLLISKFAFVASSSLHLGGLVFSSGMRLLVL